MNIVFLFIVDNNDSTYKLRYEQLKHDHVESKRHLKTKIASLKQTIEIQNLIIKSMKESQPTVRKW